MSESLRIFFYTDTFLPAVDGVVTSMLNFKKELESRGHEVYIFASGDSSTRAAVKKDPHIVVVRSMKFKKYPQYNLAILPVIASLKEINIGKADIRHVQTPFTMGFYGFMASRVNGTPLVSSFHTLFTNKEVINQYLTSSKRMQKILVDYAWAYARFFYNKSDVTIAPSRTIEQELNRRDIPNTVVVGNSVDLKRFNAKVDGSRIREKLAKGDEKIVLYIGRISKEKNIDTLIKAAKILNKKKIKFVIGGTGPSIAYYQSLVSKLNVGSKVKFVGFVKAAELPEYYAAADAFCIPSTFETQGIVSLEAMACGKPVIGADYLALRELIKDGQNGEKFAPKSSNDCARKIEKVINNISNYKKMEETAKSYSLKKTTDDLLKVYKEVIDKEK